MQKARNQKCASYISGLMQTSRSWSIRIDQLIKSFGYDLCPDEPCVYKRRSGHLDDIPFIGNNDGKIVSNRSMVSHPVNMKDLGKGSHIFEIKLM